MAGWMAARTCVEPVVAGAQVASAFYDTGLLLVVKHYYNQSNSTAPARVLEDAQQKAVSDFYIIYNLVLGLSPLLTAYGLATLSDAKDRRISLCVPLLGYLGSRLLLLLLILLQWPIEVMYGAAALNGLTGGFTTYWAGIMALGSLGSSERRRALRLIAIELTYGLAGFLGSVASGHIFVQAHINYQQGTVLVSCSLALYALCFLYSLLVLKVPLPEGTCPASTADSKPQDIAQPASQPEEDGRIAVNSGSCEDEGRSHHTPSKLIIAMLFSGAILYDLAVAGAINVLPLFLLKKPLSWGPVEIGYGNAAGYIIFITSFLGVFVFSKYLRDTTMIIIGILSFSAGSLILAFVRWTFLFYIARSVMLFALIPLPTIRSVLSKHVQGSSYGKMFVLLQLALVITGVATSTAYHKIYQRTLDWFGGFCFILSCVISCLSIIPISIVAYKQRSRSGSFEILAE
ncbi:solute carrier family 46 member 2 [Carettochelys insculpta]|uniref:solute carrier family 46 member 2 n=1 Tax=Carettochelys insculpta TaxID=44489 RepID=UPI003EBF8F6D